MKNYLTYLGSSAKFTSKDWGDLTVESQSFTDAIDGDLVVYVGNPKDNPLVRVHCLCVFADAFGSTFCDCAEQFNIAMNRITTEGSGILFYLRLDGRGEGLSTKVKATELEVSGIDTYDSRISIGASPDSRNYRKIGRYLYEKDIHNIRLLTNNPNKAKDLQVEGIDVMIVPLKVENENQNIQKLYQTKKNKFHHLL